MTTRMVISLDDDVTINDKVNYDTEILYPGINLGKIQPSFTSRLNGHPIIGGRRLMERTIVTETHVLAGDVATIKKVFDHSDGRLRVFLIANDDGADRRYVECLCTSFEAQESELVWRATLAIHDDIYFRAETETSIAWNITSSPATLTLNNPGKLPAYPRMIFKPTTNKSDTNPYLQAIGVRWLSPNAAENYPVDITNASLDTRTSATNFSDATLADLRVLVNGVLSDFWTTSANSTTTSIWVNLNFQPSQVFTLDGDVGSGDTDWVVGEDISNMKAEGLIEIAGELAFYTSKNNEQKRFSGLTRGARGTTAAAHSDGDTVTWIQHDIRITYGASSPIAYSVDNDHQPAFDLTGSTNALWDYLVFGEDDGLRSASWTASLIRGAKKYTGPSGATADPWTDIGIETDVNNALGKSVHGQYSIYNPCGITNADFVDGKIFSSHPSRWAAYIRSSIAGEIFTNEYTIAAPASVSIEESWDQDIALTSGSHYVYMVLLGNAREISTYRLETEQVTLTIGPNTPTTFLGSEVGNYDASPLYTNETTSTAIRIDYQMDLNQELEIDTAARTVTDLDDDSGQYQALTKIGGVRDEWWEFQPGDNNLKLEDDGMVGVTKTIFYRVRFYD